MSRGFLALEAFECQKGGGVVEITGEVLPRPKGERAGVRGQGKDLS